MTDYGIHTNVRALNAIDLSALARGIFAEGTV